MAVFLSFLENRCKCSIDLNCQTTEQIAYQNERYRYLVFIISVLIVDIMWLKKSLGRQGWGYRHKKNRKERADVWHK